MRAFRQFVFLPQAIFLLVSMSVVVPAAGQSSQDGATVRVHVPDFELVNQNGKAVHLYSDLVKGRKAVLINTMFTTCGTICPFIGVRISRLQQALGSCAHGEYGVISISVDPVVDTPERLRAWGTKFGAGPCWTLLTGPKPQVDAALQALRLLPPDKTSHSPSALIGRDGTDEWTQCNVLASQETLLGVVRRNLNATLSSKETTK